MTFKPKHQPQQDGIDAMNAAYPESRPLYREPPSQESDPITPERLRELVATVDAEEAAEAEIADAEQSQDHHWRGGVGRKRITMAEAEAIKRGLIGRRRYFTISERMDFLAEYEVIAEERMPLPTSTTSHAEELARRAAAAPPPMPPQPKKPNRFIAAARVLLGVDEPVSSSRDAEPSRDEDKAKPRGATFFR
jgi:hypothetical protein